jgi:hypothetical protein
MIKYLILMIALAAIATSCNHMGASDVEASSLQPFIFDSVTVNYNLTRHENDEVICYVKDEGIVARQTMSCVSKR